jgi:dTDP-4-amino-4,6-dideoxygalactose transaminase
MGDWRIPLSELDYGEAETEAALRVLASKWLSSGPEVEAFEREFAQMLEVPHAIACSSATAGLHLALLAAAVGPGDEVIQPALNFVAAANMTIASGARPVFGDIAAATEPTLDPDQIERLIGPRTKAVVVMHYGGALCRMAEIAQLCGRRGIALIEDACHAVGARYDDGSGHAPDGVMAGAIGDLGVFSFFSNKNLATGEGGMIVTHRAALAERLRLLRSHGMTSATWDRHRGHASSYGVLAHGYNYRLDELHAALGRAQLAKLARNNARRRALQTLYRTRIAAAEGWSMPFMDRVEHGAGHLMVALAPDRAERDRAVQRLRDARIQSSLHYPCVADFEAFAAWRDAALPKTRDFVARTITLPLYPAMSPDHVDLVCDVLLAC